MIELLPGSNTQSLGLSSERHLHSKGRILCAMAGFTGVMVVAIGIQVGLALGCRADWEAVLADPARRLTASAALLVLGALFALGNRFWACHGGCSSIGILLRPLASPLSESGSFPTARDEQRDRCFGFLPPVHGVWFLSTVDTKSLESTQTPRSWWKDFEFE